EGPRSLSPGRRPGFGIPPAPGGLKGRATGIEGDQRGPSGRNRLLLVSPGRWPGLRERGPSGRKRMSTVPPAPTDSGPGEAPGEPGRTDGSAPLDLAGAFRVLFNDPDARGYTFAALGALAMIFLILFQQGSDIGGLLVVVIGVAGVLLRWVAAPAFL